MSFLDSIPLFGTLANCAAIIAGGLFGLIIKKKLPEHVMTLPIQGMAFFSLSLGLSMAIGTKHPLIVIAGIAFGSITGELLDIEGRLERGTKALENKFGAEGFSAGFIAASLIFCTGSMAVLGSFEDGLGLYPSILLAKSLMDGMMSIALGASLGFGVAFSSIPILIYQGSLTLAAGWIQPYMTEAAITEMSATGGLMLMGIAVNILGLMKVRVMNMLPGLVIAVVIVKLLGL